MPLLIELLKDPDKDVRYNAVYALRGIGRGTSPPNWSICSRTRICTCAAAADALGRIGAAPKSCIAALLTDPDKEVQGAALEALGRIAEELPHRYEYDDTTVGGPLSVVTETGPQEEAEAYAGDGGGVGFLDDRASVYDGAPPGRPSHAGRRPNVIIQQWTTADRPRTIPQRNIEQRTSNPRRRAIGIVGCRLSDVGRYGRNPGQGSVRGRAGNSRFCTNCRWRLTSDRANRSQRGARAGVERRTEDCGEATKGPKPGNGERPTDSERASPPSSASGPHDRDPPQSR